MGEEEHNMVKFSCVIPHNYRDRDETLPRHKILFPSARLTSLTNDWLAIITLPTTRSHREKGIGVWGGGADRQTSRQTETE